jgi:hypothetical protein
MAVMTTSTSEPIACPFVVLIDSAEQNPFTFERIHADANHGYRPLVVHTRWQCLGRHPNQLGDYSVDGFVGRVHVERKSVGDCQGTILGFGGSRDRFEQELANLSAIEAALVVVEGSLAPALTTTNDRRTRAHKVIAKQLHRSILALMQDYRVPWLFCDGRRMAEISTFRFLERFWRKQTEHTRRVKAMLAKL